MQRTLSSRTIGIAALLAAACFSTQPARADVELTLVDGRRIVADRVVDDTDEARLVVAIEAAGIQVSRSIPWPKVDSVRVDGKTFSRSELQSQLNLVSARVAQPETQQLQPDTPAPPAALLQAFAGPLDFGPQPFDPNFAIPWSPPVNGVVISVRDDPLSAYYDELLNFFPLGVPLSETAFALELMRTRKAAQALSPPYLGIEPGLIVPPPEDIETLPAPAPALHHTSRPAVASIVLDAHAGSLGGNVDWNVLFVDVRAVDVFGQPASLQGTLNFTLHGEKVRTTLGLNPVNRVPFSRHRLSPKPTRVETLAKWTRRVDVDTPNVANPHPNDAALNGAVVRLDAATVRLILPLPRPFPDHDFRIGAFGELSAQLLAPGQGTFEASRPNLVLRQASAVRDQNIFETGTRFFPHEKTADNIRSTGVIFPAPSYSGPYDGVFTVQP